MKRIFFILFLSGAFCGYMFAADTNTTVPLATTIAPNAQIAMSTPGYLVTAGDIYMLGYLVGTTSVEYTIIVDTSYKIRVSNLAVLDAAGKSYLELKSQVEAIVTKNYPLSGVQFVLQTPAVFTVIVKGEVLNTAEINAWAFSRLSSIATPSLTKYASIRDITITSLNGKSQKFDLFKSQRFGDLGEDPYVRPGDIITVNRFSRSVTLNGAVERPGIYQLLPGEGLSNLISYYGSGLTPLCDTKRIELVRYVQSESVSGNKIFLDQRSIDSNFELQNFDTVTVSEITDLIPVMFIEGAIGPKTPANPEVSGRESVRFNKGENYAFLVRRSRALFTSVSDTAGAYIMRNGIQIPINLNPMLYDASYSSSYAVEDSDTLVVPFRQYFVSVSGAVTRPGRFPYIQDRDWSYYVALAGGFDTTRNNFSWVTITDIQGKQHKKADPITPETVIDASNNTVRYYFGQYSPVIVTTLGIIVSYYTVRDILAAHP